MEGNDPSSLANQKQRHWRGLVMASQAALQPSDNMTARPKAYFKGGGPGNNAIIALRKPDPGQYDIVDFMIADKLRADADAPI